MIRFDATEREFTEEEQRETTIRIAVAMVQLEWHYARLARLYWEWEEYCRREGAKEYDKALRFGKFIEDLVRFQNWSETAFSEVFKALNLT